MSKEQSDQEQPPEASLPPSDEARPKDGAKGGRMESGQRKKKAKLSTLNSRQSNLVIVFGTFDLLHPGHIFFLNTAKNYGDLKVMVTGDARVKELKGRLPHENEKARVSNLKKVGFNAFLEQKNPLDDLLKHAPTVLVLGYDQNWEEKAHASAKNADLSLKIIKIDKAHKPHLYKTSVLRKTLSSKK